MLTILLVDAELELVPQSITGHQQVVTAAYRFGVKPNDMLLDSSLHYAAMRKLEEGERRGRPDLIHFFLLTGLESMLNQRGQLRLLLHTREGNLIRVDPETRLVRNFNRFCGLIQQLFKTGRVPPDRGLLTMEKNRTPADVFAEVKPDRVVILDEEGARAAPWDVFQAGDGAKNVLAIVGGFPSGRFTSPLPEGERISLGPDLLSVWTVASELIVNYERVAPPGTRRQKATATPGPPDTE